MVSSDLISIPFYHLEYGAKAVTLFWFIHSVGVITIHLAIANYT